MSELIQKFLSYQATRDVVFVFGAGASYPDGVPLQRHILPMILNDKKIYDSVIGKSVIDFVKENFAFDSEKNLYPQLEAVFGFLDYFIFQNENLSSKYSVSVIREIKEYLIKSIHYVVNLYTDKESKIYQKFWETTFNHTDNFSILTLNYDTLLEQAFSLWAGQKAYIDYCIYLMNYNRQKEFSQYNFWVNPREPVLVSPLGNPIPIKIIKLHGSLNWKYCSCCNQTLLTPWDREIDLSRGKFTGYTYPDKLKYDFACPNDGTEFETLIIMPSYVKPLNQPIISQLMSEAAREIRSTKKVVFIGYSLSNADLHIRALFKKQITDDVKIIVVNTRETEEFKLKYFSISKNVEFINSSFEKLLSDSSLIEKLFD